MFADDHPLFSCAKRPYAPNALPHAECLEKLCFEARELVNNLAPFVFDMHGGPFGKWYALDAIELRNFTLLEAYNTYWEFVEKSAVPAQWLEAIILSAQLGGISKMRDSCFDITGSDFVHLVTSARRDLVNKRIPAMKSLHGHCIALACCDDNRIYGWCSLMLAHIRESLCRIAGLVVRPVDHSRFVADLLKEM